MRIFRGLLWGLSETYFWSPGELVDVSRGASKVIKAAVNDFKTKKEQGS